MNVPEHVTVDEIADLHRLSWELGLKSVAIYRDNSKVGQPLSTSKPTVTDVTEMVEVGPDGFVERIIERVVHQPVRQKLPRTRRRPAQQFAIHESSRIQSSCSHPTLLGSFLGVRRAGPGRGRPGELPVVVVQTQQARRGGNRPS